jgi:hypothetical protein
MFKLLKGTRERMKARETSSRVVRQRTKRESKKENLFSDILTEKILETYS